MTVAPEHSSARTLTEMLTLEQVAEDRFRSVHPSRGSTWFFGGEVAGHAILAAGATRDPERRVHHANFQYLRAGNATKPTDYRVRRELDGNSFSSRAVEAWQGEQLLLTASISFQVVDPDGFSHQIDPDDAAPFALPAPEERYQGDERFRNWHTSVTEDRDLEFVFVDPPVRVAGQRGEATAARQRSWTRVRSVLRDDPLLHAAALAYASDCLFLSAALGPHRIAYGDPNLKFATLNHTVWFHEPGRADEWFLYDQRSPWAGGSRGLCHGRIYDKAGTVLVSTAQEGLLRRRSRKP